MKSTVCNKTSTLLFCKQAGPSTTHKNNCSSLRHYAFTETFCQTADVTEYTDICKQNYSN